MHIRFISSLTPDDEDRFAPGLLTAIGNLLDHMPISYAVRIETAGGKVLEYSHAETDPTERTDA